MIDSRIELLRKLINKIFENPDQADYIWNPTAEITNIEAQKSY